MRRILAVPARTVLTGVMLFALMVPAAGAQATPPRARERSGQSGGPRPRAVTQAAGFSARPDEFSASDPATRAYFKLRVRRGGTYRGAVVVGDTSSAPLRLRAYAVDGLTGVTSGVVYGDADDPIRSPGTWLTLRTGRLAFGSQAVTLLHFQVTVPRNAAPGIHLAGVALQSAHPPRTPGRFSIKEIFRVVVGVEIRVPGRARRAISLGHATIQPLPGTALASVQIGLANRGGLLCRPRVSVGLRGHGVDRMASRQLDVILPGDSIPYRFPWPTTLTPGEYRLHVRASGCGPAATLAANVSAGSPLRGTRVKARPAARVVVKKASAASRSWIIVLVAACGLAVGLLSGRRLRRRD